MTPQEALSQAMHAAEHAPYCVCRAIEVDRERAAAILATEPMQAIARQAAIGAAVERLERDRYDVQTHTYHDHDLGFAVDGWMVTDRLTGDEWERPTLPAAILEATR